MDVGAYSAQWSEAVRQIFPSSQILMVEAQSSMRSTLENAARRLGGSIHIQIALLGAQSGKVVPFWTMQTGSSVFEEASSYTRTCEERTMRTLEEVIAESYPEWRGIDLLKLDVQGYELEILRGSGTWLHRTEMVLLEASLIPTNRGCPLIGEVFEFMSAQNFRLLDFCSQIRRKDGALWQMDLLFINNSSNYLPRADLTEENW